MTPPDTSIHRQTRRHIFPLLGIAFVVLLGVGVIVYWVVEEMVTSPAPPITEPAERGEVSPADVRSGDVDVPEGAPTIEVEPGLDNPQATPAPGPNR